MWGFSIFFNIDHKYVHIWQMNLELWYSCNIHFMGKLHTCLQISVSGFTIYTGNSSAFFGVF